MLNPSPGHEVTTLYMVKGLSHEYFKPFYLEDRANFLSIKVLKRNKKGFHARMLNERKSFDLYMKSSSCYEKIIIETFSCRNFG